MKLNLLLICIALVIRSSVSVNAQNQRSISACDSSSRSQHFVGERLRLPLPKDAILRKGRDTDYSSYSIGFGKKKSRVWLSGIFGLNATSGKVSDKQLSFSTNISQRIWKFDDVEGVDARGNLSNGNHWRYFGQYGESLEYYDVTAEAAAYFDMIIDNLCYQE